MTIEQLVNGHSLGFDVSGGLGPRWWWYIPETGIYHHSKLTRHGPAGPAFRRRKEQQYRPPVQSECVACGNDEGGEPGLGRAQGRTAAAAARDLIIGEAR